MEVPPPAAEAAAAADAADASDELLTSARSYFHRSELDPYLHAKPEIAQPQGPSHSFPSSLPPPSFDICISKHADVQSIYIWPYKKCYPYAFHAKSRRKRTV